MKVYSIRDMKAQTYLRPTVSPSTADALRNFEIVANEGDSMIARFPNDFRMYHLADFDPITGVLDVLERPADLGAAADFKRPSVPTPMFPPASATS